MTLPTPEQLSKANTEDASQVAFFCWCASNTSRFPLLKTIFHVPNGALRDKITASRLKAAGVRAGVWDVCLPVSDASWRYKALWVEFKKAPNKLTKEQIEFQQMLKDQWYDWFVAYSWEEAARKVCSYFGGEF